jgi:glycosyltransferase involved in cell wall biosynthesis
LFGLLFQSHRLLRDADAILTCNGNEAGLLRERYPSKSVVVQPHGVPMPAYEHDHRGVARDAFPQICGRPMLLNVGRIDPVKNQSWLVEQAPEILGNFPEAILVLAGPCTDEAYGRLISEQIKTLGLQERVLLTGGFASSDPRLIGLMQEARALILCSISETFGLVLLEAWAAGTAVLASRTSGAKALVQEGENGCLFDLEQPAEFHCALQKVLNNPTSAKQMAARGSELVRNEYSVSALAGRLKSLYEGLIQEKQCTT